MAADAWGDQHLSKIFHRRTFNGTKASWSLRYKRWCSGYQGSSQIFPNTSLGQVVEMDSIPLKGMGRWLGFPNEAWVLECQVTCTVQPNESSSKMCHFGTEVLKDCVQGTIFLSPAAGTLGCATVRPQSALWSQWILVLTNACSIGITGKNRSFSGIIHWKFVSSGLQHSLAYLGWQQQQFPTRKPFSLPCLKGFSCLKYIIRKRTPISWELIK